MTPPAPPDQPSSTSPNFEWAWQGYLGFWNRASLGQETWGQVERYALDWGIPLDLKPIMGADIFSDIAQIAQDVARLVASVVANIGMAVWNFVWGIPQFIGNMWTQLQYIGSGVWDRLAWLVTTIWSGVEWIANNIWNGVTWLNATLWSGVTWVANNIWNGLSWVATTMWDFATWLVPTVLNGVTWIANNIWNGLTWAGQKVWEGITWAGNTVWNALMWVAAGVSNAVQSVATTIWSAVTWAGQKVWEGITWAGQQAWAGLTWLGEHIWDGANAVWQWIWDNFIEEIPAFFSGVNNLINGIVRSAEAEEMWAWPQDFDRDINSPVGRTLFYILASLSMLLTVPSQLSTVYSMPSFQRAAAATGAALLSKTELRDLTLRELPVGRGAFEQLRLYGLSDDNVNAIMNLWQNAIAPPSDLIRMAVREVFGPLAEGLGLFQEFPPDFAKWMRQQGFQEQWAKFYWGAHWDLPSPSQGYEMLHRDIITKEELETLLRALDYAIPWRDPLIRISYNPITRLDLRRMFRNGSIGEARTLRGYKDIGYSPEDAQLLVDGLKAELVGVERDLPAGALLRAYRKRLISRAELEAALRDMEFSEEAIDLQVALTDFAAEEERADLVERIVKTDYQAGTLDQAAAMAALADAGVPQERIFLLLDLWTVERAPRIVTLTASQILRLYTEGHWTADMVRPRVGALGYNAADTEDLLRIAAPEAAPPEVRELTVAQLQAAARRGYLSGFGQVQAQLDALVENGVAIPSELAIFRNRLTERGYPDEDAWRIVALSFPDQPRPAGVA